jgi:hypothetical protein
MSDLEVLPGRARRKDGFGATAIDSPRSTRARGQANIALSAHRVAHQECRVTRRWRNSSRSSWGHDFPRRCIAARITEHKNGYEQALKSLSLVHLLTAVLPHLFLLRFAWRDIGGGFAHSDRIPVAHLHDALGKP